MSVLFLALLLADLWFSGVRSTATRTGPTLPAREKHCDVDFIKGTESDRTHELVGTIHVYVRRNSIAMGRRGVYEEAVPEFRKQACKLGADAIVVLQQTVSHSGEFKLLYVKGDAIRYLVDSKKK